MRVGGKKYAQEHNSYGVATLQCRHGTINGPVFRLCCDGKGGQPWQVSFDDIDLARAIGPLRPRAAGGALLACQCNGGRRGISAESDNDYLRLVAGDTFTAKDLRTWQAPVTAARALDWPACHRSTPAARKRMLSAGIEQTARFVSGTAAVALGSYIDPRLLEAFLAGRSTGMKTSRPTESAVRSFLSLTGSVAAG